MVLGPKAEESLPENSSAMAPELDSLTMVVGLVADPIKKSTSCIRTRSSIKTGKAKLSAKERAEEIISRLDPKSPSFVKLMLRSHVTGCFWLGIPSQFSSNLPKEIVEFTLLDENGEEYPVKYFPKNPNKPGLSGGWKGFAVAQKLVAGDTLVFQLIEVTKFKVYIVRACGSAEVDGAIGLLKLEARAKESDRDDAGKVFKTITKPALKRAKLENFSHKLSGSDQLPVKVTTSTKKPAQKRVKFHPSVVFHGDDQSPQLSGSDQPENQSEEVIDSEVWEGIKFSSSIAEFQDMKNLERFNITVDGLIIDSEVSEQVRTKYYELCCSQNSFLHEHLQELNCTLVAGMISETVNIADAIRASNLKTSRDEFAKWENNLKAFKQLGMNVDFLLSRLENIVNMAFESEDAVDSRRNREVMIGRTRAQRRRTLEMKLVELEDASKRFEKEITTLKLKLNAKKLELKFRGEVNAPW